MSLLADREVLTTLGDNLRRLREARGLTQTGLGTRCGFTQQYISNVEQGTENITTINLVKLSRGLECNTDDLLTRLKTP